MHHLVPAQWGGSVQHYYHFLLAYLFPVTLWVADHPDARPVVRDCGPMNPWFDVVSEGGFTVVPPGVMLHHFARGAPATVLPASDDPESFDGHRLARFRTEVLERAGVEAPEEASSIMLVRRGRSDPYYATEASEQRSSGAFRRSIPNVADLADALSARWPTRLVDPAELDPAEQLRLHAGTRTLIGQHGAGLANMIWMPPGSAVIEVLPPMPDHLSVIFANLAAALGHRYTVIPQQDAHAPVDADELASAVASATSGDRAVEPRTDDRADASRIG